MSRARFENCFFVGGQYFFIRESAETQSAAEKEEKTWNFFFFLRCFCMCVFFVEDAKMRNAKKKCSQRGKLRQKETVTNGLS